MCYPTTCAGCGRTTWAGCGEHAQDVRASVPAEQWCTCDAGGDGAQGATTGSSAVR